MNRLALVLSFLLVLPISLAFADTTVTASGDAALSTDSVGNTSFGSSLEVKGHDGIEASSSVTAQGEDARQAKDSEHGSTSTEKSGEQASLTADDQASTTGEHGADMSEEHRSVVASVVQSLLADSERDGGIGAEVRAVAVSQQESASTTATAIAKVEGRSKIWSVLFGTDWKNVGILRSQIAQTDADAARLEAAISSTTDTSLKASLTTQLDAIKAEQAKVIAFVDAEEHAFSFFGWFTKLFVNTGTSATTTVQ